MRRSRFFNHVHGLYEKAEQEGSVTLTKEQLQKYTSAVIAEVSGDVLGELGRGFMKDLRQARDESVQEFDNA